MAFVYCIRNNVDSKVYIGQTTRKKCGRRWSEHKELLKKQQHSNLYLQDAWSKHGESSFSFEILCEAHDLDELVKKEKYYLDKYYPHVYNIIQPARTSAQNINSKEFASIAVSSNTADELRHYCKPRHWKMNYVVEELLKAFISGTLQAKPEYTGSLFSRI